MGLLALNCPNCGSKLEVQEGREEYYCSYCGAKVVQDHQKIEVSGDLKVTGIANENSLLERAFILMQEKDFSAAEKRLEQVLDANPKCSRAYLGKLMISLKCPNLDKLPDSSNAPLFVYEYFNRANEYANDEEKQLINTLSEASIAHVKSLITLPKQPAEVREPKTRDIMVFALGGFLLPFIFILVAIIISHSNVEMEWLRTAVFPALVLGLLGYHIGNREYKKDKERYKTYREELAEFEEASKNPSGYKDRLINGYRRWNVK